MRDPRPGLAWSKRRVSRRAEYADWMTSREWQARRQRWLHAWVAAHQGAEPSCGACGRRWTLRHGDLHHRSYDRLGHERDDDLIPLCRVCHTRVHRMMESPRAWRRVGREHATDVIVARLRRATGQE